MVDFYLDSFAYGERLSALDISLAGSSRPKVEEQPLPTPEEQICNEIKSFSAEELEQNLMVFYHCDGFCYHTFDNERMMHLSLACQNSVCSQHFKFIKKCLFCAVYYRKGTKWVPLWRTGSFEAGYKPDYLSVKELKQKLHLVFKDFTIKLGEFKEKEITGVKFIAWQVMTDKGEVYYIPWHNGVLLPALPEYVFEEKSLASLQGNTYKVLRFGAVHDIVGKGVYHIIRC